MGHFEGREDRRVLHQAGLVCVGRSEDTVVSDPSRPEQAHVSHSAFWIYQVAVVHRDLAQVDRLSGRQRRGQKDSSVRTCLVARLVGLVVLVLVRASEVPDYADRSWA